MFENSNFMDFMYLTLLSIHNLQEFPWITSTFLKKIQLILLRRVRNSITHLTIVCNHFCCFVEYVSFYFFLTYIVRTLILFYKQRFISNDFLTSLFSKNFKQRTRLFWKIKQHWAKWTIFISNIKLWEIL